MRGCRRCDYPTLQTLRASTAQRAGREYVMYWYSCPRCGDISFAYRHAPLPDAAPETGARIPALLGR